MGTRVACLLAVAAASGCSAPPPAPPFKVVADTKALMVSVVDPSADVVWEAVKTIITAEGTEEIRPRTEAQWTAVRNSAITLAESGNLMMIVPRAKDGDAWMARARELIEASEAAIRAVEVKDADRLFVVGGEIYESCTKCHVQYMDAIVKADR